VYKLLYERASAGSKEGAEKRARAWPLFVSSRARLQLGRQIDHNSNINQFAIKAQCAMTSTRTRRRNRFLPNFCGGTSVMVSAEGFRDIMSPIRQIISGFIILRPHELGVGQFFAASATYTRTTPSTGRMALSPHRL
jgi:hypothetical protein